MSRLTAAALDAIAQRANENECRAGQKLMAKIVFAHGTPRLMCGSKLEMLATLPIEYERRFSIQLYWPSHGPLLLRSCKSQKFPTRIDILFCDVRWMALPVWLEGIRIERGELSDIPLPLTATIKEEAHFMSVFKVISQEVTHYVLAADSVRVAEDRKDSPNSLLLPHFDFRAFIAPLWKKDK